jgi:D,D-heptose 1,7-bisphosphate phosphatase
MPRTKAIFLDRDGTINKYVGELSKEDDFILYSFAAHAIRKINQAGYLVVVITNQPMIAKGFLTALELENIHKKMDALLNFERAKLNAIYYCPHHPTKGFRGEVKELKISCDCRKPGIGLVKQAEKDFNINLRKSFFIGDSTMDAKTAENAGIPFIGVKTGNGLRDGKYSLSMKFSVYEDLLDAVNHIIK